MIQLIEEQGLASTVLTCDVCGGIITDAGMAIVRWRRSKALDRVVHQMEFCHKGDCDHDSEAHMSTSSWELRHFLARLATSAGMNPMDTVHAIVEATGTELKPKELQKLAADQGYHLDID
jgi:hypothetical protein